MSIISSEIDEQTLQECIKKNRKSQERLYKKYYGYIISVSLRYSKSKNEAQEITNDSFVKIFSALERYNPKQSFKGWIRRIAINTAIDYYRKELKHSHHLDLDSPGVQDINIQEVDQLDYEDALKLLNELPEIYRITFNLYEIEGYTHDEIGEVLKITPSSSRVYLMRAKKKLRDSFNKHFDNNNPTIDSNNKGLASGLLK